ncbi:MAG: ATP synthase F0 subunit B [Chitinophagaceae bacterium]|nr:ATP synthase F0 subunit B [Oligoflexus sp.]
MENFDLLNSFIFPYVNLAIFLVLAVYILKKPIQNALRGKRDSYLVMLERANHAKEEAERKHREIEARFKALDSEMNRIRAEVKESADLEAQAILTSAQQLAEHLKHEAKRIAVAEITAAKEAVRADILQQVKQKTAEELARTLDDSRQHKIVQQSLNTLPNIKELKL